jgi:hypothetical protein
MHRRSIVFASLVLGGAFLGACETMTEKQRQQAMGAGVGSAIGAASCLLVGRCDTKDAVIRTAAGAAVGWVAVRITQANSEKRSDAPQEAAVLGYSPLQGTVVKLQNAAIDPTYCGAGEEVHFSMEYTVLAPPETPTLPVEERWVILKEGKPQITLDNGTHERDQGRWVSHASIHLPQQVPAGTYVVKNEITAGSRYDLREVVFYVQ